MTTTSRFHGDLAGRYRLARQLPALTACGCIRDPDHDKHRCDSPRPTERDVDGYGAAVAHLDRHGLTAAPRVDELRALWRRGGAERRLAQQVVQRWAVSV